MAQDHRNNVVALLDDATGTLDRVMHYTPEGLSTHYSESGQVLCDEKASLIVTCTELNMPFGLNGMWRSNTTGLSHMRNRWYSPQLGQFMSHDPLEYINSYDLYAFAKLDPINFWDPWGLSGGNLTFKSSKSDDEARIPIKEPVVVELSRQKPSICITCWHEILRLASAFFAQAELVPQGHSVADKVRNQHRPSKKR